jgi:cytochrome b subunit of formate dehydrogenase
VRRSRGPEVERFSLAQRIEHGVLLVLFNVLALTGLPQKYSYTAWAGRLIAALGGIGRTRFIHRTAAVLLVTLGIYHLIVVLATRKRSVRRHSMGLSFVDLVELTDDVRFLVGLRSSRPAMGRFDYRQKFEYWAVLWGTVLMATTGLVMWFPVFVTRWLPGVVIPASRVAHGGEALLALFAVIIWHFYNAHFRPDIFPMDPAMFTGKIALERMEHEHRGELEELKQGGLLPPPVEAAPAAQPDAAAEAGGSDQEDMPAGQ